MDLWRQYVPELTIDLYELTMAESYLREGMTGEATFSLFIREYPENRAYFVAAGLEHLLDLISRFSFRKSSIEFLEGTGRFSPALLEYLERFRFSGSIRALPEGCVFFAQEPVLEVTAPIVEAQILETLIMNVIHLETLIAGKAARCVRAAGGRPVVDFSLRRTHGVDAGVKVARAAYLAGFAGTSNVLAGKLFGIPLFGTMAHSYITSFDRETDAFLAFARAYPDNTVLLIDTYDTVRGARKALKVARALAAEGRSLRGVRLDSGDFVSLSRQVREVFNRDGFGGVRILASGNLDEYRIQALIEGGAEIDLFAVGTRLGVCADAPSLDIAYKLVEYGGRPVLKLSSGKRSWAGRKQIYRCYDREGRMSFDLLDLQGEGCMREGRPLLETCMENGVRIRPPESLEIIRERFRREADSLPPSYHLLRDAPRFPVRIGPALEACDAEATACIRRTDLEE